MPPTKLIQVDIDPEEIGRNYPVEIGMVGDAKAFLAQALRIARAQRRAPLATADAWTARDRRLAQPIGATSASRSSARTTCRSSRAGMMAEMNRISPPDTVMVDDVGNCQVWSEQYWKTEDSRQPS